MEVIFKGKSYSTYRCLLSKSFIRDSDLCSMGVNVELCNCNECVLPGLFKETAYTDYSLDSDINSSLVDSSFEIFEGEYVDDIDLMKEMGLPLFFGKIKYGQTKSKNKNRYTSKNELKNSHISLNENFSVLTLNPTETNICTPINKVEELTDNQTDSVIQNPLENTSMCHIEEFTHSQCTNLDQENIIGELSSISLNTVLKVTGNAGEDDCSTCNSWNRHWAGHGDDIVWQSWLSKYSDYIASDYCSGEILSVVSFLGEDLNITKTTTASSESISENDSESYSDYWQDVWNKHYNDQFIENYNMFLMEECKSIVETSNICTYCSYFAPNSQGSDEKDLNVNDCKFLESQPSGSKRSFNVISEVESISKEMNCQGFSTETSSALSAPDVPIPYKICKRIKDEYWKKKSSSEGLSEECNVLSKVVNFLELAGKAVTPETSNTTEAIVQKINSKVSKTDRCKKEHKCMIPDEVKSNPDIKKYWAQRYRLFSRYDKGIKLDTESWFSVTPERISKHIATRCKSDVIIDAFCGAGGNTIQFAFTCRQVIAIDIDPNKVELARHNASIYGVEHKIEFIVGDFMQIGPKLVADVVYLSLPWGGPDYIHDEVFNLQKTEPDCFEVMKVAQNITKNIALFVPKNSSVNQLVQMAGCNNKVEVEQNILNKKVKTITAYYGNLVNL